MTVRDVFREQLQIPGRERREAGGDGGGRPWSNPAPAERSIRSRVGGARGVLCVMCTLSLSPEV